MAAAVEATEEVGPKGHFFGFEHIQQRYEHAFYEPFLRDWRDLEAWELDDANWTTLTGRR